MKIETTRFGSQEVEQETILHFPKGLLSANNNSTSQLKDFKLFHKEESDSSKKENAIVFWLQAIDDPEIAYEIIDPSSVNFYYDIALPDEDYELLESQSPEEIVMMLVITEAEKNQHVTGKKNISILNGNITQPVFINLNSKKGLQRSIKDLEYDIFLNIPVIDL
ncbi:MAG: flagellar assembly protein FliW [gamma proteobacterium symbiont of Taylorina sp.]|nr:flagellar assembly protein FliW [gamma proteobacterium symbiont of Taylorina sp.]